MLHQHLRLPAWALAATLAATAFAQTTTPPPEEKKIPVETKPDDSKTKKADEEVAVLEKVEVTGSRLRTLGDEATAVPVFTVPQVELERRGVNRLADIRWAIPQLSGSVGFNDNLTNSGTSRAQTVSTSFNLRGLGGNSTLVLVDGRRLPHTGQEAPGGAGGREDFSIDGIPVSAIERIDILPQGAGAVYGSEAIAGVVNIVLKKNYSGAELTTTYDNTFDTDVAQTSVALTAGYRSGKLSTFFTASWEKQNGMAARDRWWTATYDSRTFGSTSTSFLYSATAGAGSLSTAYYPAYSSGTTIPGQTSYVTLIPTGSNGSTTANAGATAVTAANVPLYDGAAYATSIDPAERQSYLFRADYQLFSNLQIYGDLRWSQNKNEYVGTPITLTTQLPVGAPGNPYTVPVYLSKVFYDLPLPRTNSYQDNLGAVLGARGDLFADWRYDVSASWARNVVRDDAITAAGFNYTLLSAALASANKPILAYDSSTTSNPNAAGVLEALMPFGDHKDTTDTYQYLATTDGTVWDGWAGPMRAAVGAEFGEEKVKFHRDAAASASYLLTKPFSRDYTAGFVETSIPLLSATQHIPLVHLVEVGGAVRHTDYSDVGNVTTPTYRVLFQPVKWLTFRASRAEGFKPVRLYDLQAPISSYSTTYTASRNIKDPLRKGEAVVGTFSYTSGGNPTLHSEESVSRNAGVVFDVPGSLFKGLSFSADYYEIDYSERSGSTSLQILLDYFPERIVRAALTDADKAAGYTGGVVTGWDATNINLSWVKTKGWDYRVSYQRNFSFGDLSVIGSYSDPDLIVTKATPAATPTTTGTQQPVRSTGSVFLQRGAWGYGVVVNYQARYYINGFASLAYSYPSYIEWDPQVSYRFAHHPAGPTWLSRALADTKLTATIVNLFDKDPTLTDAANSRYAGDPRLRRFVLSLNKKF